MSANRTISPVTCDVNSLPLTLRPFKGFNSATKVHEASEWLAGMTKPITIFYCGDHDASGRCIDVEGSGRVVRYGSGQFTLKRLAVHKSDIREFNLPPQQVKDTDSRARIFREEYGEDTIELDALPPVELRRRIRAAIESKLDLVKWQRAIEVEKVELASILESVSEWGSKGIMLDGQPRYSTTKPPLEPRPREALVERFLHEADRGLGAYLLPENDDDHFGRLEVLSKKEVDEIRRALASGERLGKVAANHGLAEEQISRIAPGLKQGG